MDAAEHRRALERAGGELARHARGAGPAAAVPTCPDWTVEQLVTHQASVHRWAAEIVAHSRSGPPSAEESEVLFARPEDQGIFEWYDDGLARLVSVLSDAPDDLECWTFLPAPSPLAFWSRRQAHETSIHCADAAISAGRTPTFAPKLAEDGLDELLLGFYGRSGSRLAGEPSLSISLRATDVARSWTLQRSGDGVAVTDAFDGDCRVSGSASDVYLFAWNRLPELAHLTVDGDRSTLSTWREVFTI